MCCAHYSIVFQLDILKFHGYCTTRRWNKGFRKIDDVPLLEKISNLLKTIEFSTTGGVPHDILMQKGFKFSKLPSFLQLISLFPFSIKPSLQAYCTVSCIEFRVIKINCYSKIKISLLAIKKYSSCFSSISAFNTCMADPQEIFEHSGIWFLQTLPENFSDWGKKYPFGPHMHLIEMLLLSRTYPSSHVYVTASS